MKITSSLILLISLALTVLVGIMASNDLTGEVSTTEAILSDGAGNIISPILTVFGFLSLIVGYIIAVNSFS